MNCSKTTVCGKNTSGIPSPQGYGRRMVAANEVVTEITANARAARWLMRGKTDVRTLINIGGQDCKVIAFGH